jgi:hypothetical protein
MDLVVRQASQADRDVIRHIYARNAERRCGALAGDGDVFEHVDGAAITFLVALDGRRPVAFCALCRRPDAAGARNVSLCCYLLPEYADSGLDQVLTGLLRRVARRLGLAVADGPGAPQPTRRYDIV